MPTLLQEVPAAEAPTHKDRFYNVEDLWNALEEYGQFHDDTTTRKYDPDRVRGRGGGEANFSATQERIMHQNQIIDRAMRRLRVMAPVSHRLLDAYYRRSGPSGTAAAHEEATGWTHAARYAGLMPHRHERLARATFDVLLEDAVWQLFVAQHARRFFRP